MGHPSWLGEQPSVGMPVAALTLREFGRYPGVVSGVIGAVLARRVHPLEPAALGAHVHDGAGALGYRAGLLTGTLPDLVARALGALGRGLRARSSTAAGPSATALRTAGPHWCPPGCGIRPTQHPGLQ